MVYGQPEENQRVTLSTQLHITVRAHFCIPDKPEKLGHCFEDKKSEWNLRKFSLCRRRAVLWIYCSSIAEWGKQFFGLGISSH
jgi:hypothetical protein